LRPSERRSFANKKIDFTLYFNFYAADRAAAESPFGQKKGFFAFLREILKNFHCVVCGGVVL